MVSPFKCYEMFKVVSIHMFHSSLLYYTNVLIIKPFRLQIKTTGQLKSFQNQYCQLFFYWTAFSTKLYIHIQIQYQNII